MTDPVQRSGNGKCGHLGVTRLDRSVSDSIGDVLRETSDRCSVCRRERSCRFFSLRSRRSNRTRLAPKSVAMTSRIGVHQLPQLDEAAAAAGVDRGDKIVDPLLPERPALEQDFFLAAKVIVKRGLGDIQPFGDLVQGRAMIALLKKQLHGGPQHGVALLVARAAAALERQPGGGIEEGGGASISVSACLALTRVCSGVYYPLEI